MKKFLIVFFVAAICYGSICFAQESIDIERVFFGPPEEYLTAKNSMHYDFSKVDIPAKDFPYDADIYSKKDILSVPSDNVSDVLKYSSGIFVIRNGDSIQPSLLSIDGGLTNYTKIIVDGVELNTQLDGTVDMSNFLTFETEKIEVGKGAFSSIWGTGLSGVVFVKTKDPDKEKNKCELVLGSHNSYSLNLQLAMKEKNFSFLFIPQFYETSGYMDGGESRRKNYLGKIFYDISGTLKLKLSLHYKNADIGEYEQAKYGARTELSSNLFFGNFEIIKTFDEYKKFKVSFNGYEVNGERKYFSLNPDSFLLSRPSSEKKIGILCRYDVSGLESKIGLESSFYHYDMESSGFTGTEDLDTYYFSAGLLKKISENFDLLGSARYDYNSEFGSDVSFDFGGSFDFRDSKIKVIFSKSFNTPPANCAYINNPLRKIKSNTSLSSERACGVKLFFEKPIYDSLLINTRLYYQKIKDGILLTRDIDGFYMFDNVEKLRRSGIEANLLWSFLEKKGLLKIGASFNDYYNETKGEIVEGQGRIKYTATISYEFIKNVTGTISGYYIWWNMPASYNSEDRKFIFDLKISKSFNKGKIYAAVYNLFNQKQYWIDVLPNDGRHYKVGLSFAF